MLVHSRVFFELSTSNLSIDGRIRKNGLQLTERDIYKCLVIDERPLFPDTTVHSERFCLGTL